MVYFNREMPGTADFIAASADVSRQISVLMSIDLHHAMVADTGKHWTERHNSLDHGA
jgi:hypothetical protein